MRTHLLVLFTLSLIGFCFILGRKLSLTSLLGHKPEDSSISTLLQLPGGRTVSMAARLEEALKPFEERASDAEVCSLSLSLPSP
jgi:hypothetical protein